MALKIQRNIKVDSLAFHDENSGRSSPPLRSFNDEYLSGYFDRMILLEGNDGRGINVGRIMMRW
jgi:hypothetical protein